MTTASTWAKAASVKAIAEGVVLYTLSAGAGFLAHLVEVPLAWMIGPLLVTTAWMLAVRTVEPPIMLRATGQLVIGVAMGLTMTPAAFARVSDSFFLIAAAGGLTILAGGFLAFVLSAVSRLDRSTALFSCVPGGPVEMANLAAATGGDPAHVALAQTIRIGLIVLIFPQILLSLETVLPVHPQHAVVVGDLPVLAGVFLLALISAIAARFVRLLNPFFLGPLLLVGCLASMAFPVPPIPDLVVAIAQIFLGVSIGSLFQRNIIRNSLRSIGTVLVTTSLLFAFCIQIAIGLSTLFAGSIGTLILANAPGGATEMALTAQATGQDVSLVVAFQIVRVVMIAALLPLVARLVMRLRNRNTSSP